MNNAPYILCLETSTKNCSVTLSSGEGVLCLKEDCQEGYSHSEKLHQFIHDCLGQLQILPSQLSAVAVSSGPGSYTGLRIGVSAAKGLCFAVNIPLISISSLQTIARDISVPEKDVIISIMDAGRMEVYSATYDAQYREISLETNIKVDADSFTQFGDKHCHFVGTGLSKLENVISLPSASFLERNPSAQNMTPIAFDKYNNKSFEDIAYFVPNYLKPYVVHHKTKLS